MPAGKEFRSKYFARSPLFHYLSPADRYLFAEEPPRYRFNIIGVGMNGQEHLRATLLEGRATVHGVFDPNPGSVAMAQHWYQQLAPQGELVVYDSLAAACHDPDVDGLIICTPNHTHLVVVQEAIQSGKHILLEKPMATTISDAHAITLLAQEYEAVFQVGLQYRYKAIYVEAIQEALARESLGAIKTISLMEHRVPFLDKVGQWNKFAAQSGGTLVEKCCHYFDLMNLFAQARPVLVFASGGAAVNFTGFTYGNEPADIIDHALVTVRYANDAQASLNLCMFAPLFYEELVLCGDAGRLKASETQDFLNTARPHTQLEVMRGEGGPSRVASPVYPTYIEDIGHGGSTYFEHARFIDQIEGQPTEAATAREGLWSIIVGVAAEESIQTGQPVRIDDLLAQHHIAL